jgi:hypothetical protein
MAARRLSASPIEPTSEMLRNTYVPPSLPPREGTQAMAGQDATVGDNSIAIQVAGDNVVISVGTVSLTLARRHLLKARPRNERELLITEIRGTDLVGRDADLAALNAWLRAPHDLPAVRCLTGRAGAGKTRLAIELCEQAEASGWTAGFATLAELQRFHDARSLEDWRWGKPTLIVVDYAAASARMLRAWLEALARRRPAPDEAPLRLLLLERHADRQVGWWADLIRPGGLSGRGPDELASPAEPVPLPPLDSPADRRALLRQVVGLAAGFVGKAVPDIPPEGADVDFDRRAGWMLSGRISSGRLSCCASWPRMTGRWMSRLRLSAAPGTATQLLSWAA